MAKKTIGETQKALVFIVSSTIVGVHFIVPGGLGFLSGLIRSVAHIVAPVMTPVVTPMTPMMPPKEMGHPKMGHEAGHGTGHVVVKHVLHVPEPTAEAPEETPEPAAPELGVGGHEDAGGHDGDGQEPLHVDDSKVGQRLNSRSKCRATLTLRRCLKRHCVM